MKKGNTKNVWGHVYTLDKFREIGDILDYIE
jgi:hypothetical protein